MDALQVIAEPRRRQILALIWNSEMAAGEIAAMSEVTFGAVSQHLSILRGAGFVTVRREGNRRLYQADRDGLGPLREVLEVMWSEALHDLADTIAADRASKESEG
ncbi:MAG: ArsR/SmtB family transcription factor [Acidimicrobiia bacterium]